MLDPETFLTELYVAVDDFCEAHLPRDAAYAASRESLCGSASTSTSEPLWSAGSSTG